MPKPLLLIVLLGCAGLLRAAPHFHAGAHLADVQPGYDTAHVLTMSVAAMQGDGWQRFHTEVLERVSVMEPRIDHSPLPAGAGGEYLIQMPEVIPIQPPTNRKRRKAPITGE